MYYVYPQRGKQTSGQKRRAHAANRERAINPDTGKKFRDPRSKITKDGRVICRGADMKALRERVGEREGEICQGCGEWTAIYPAEGQTAGEMHHKRGRGMGSSKRNDIASEMEWLCGGPSGCHRKAKIEPMFRMGDEL